MHTNYKLEERTIKAIVLDNIRSTSPNNKVRLITYYNNKKACNLVMQNNTNPLPSTDQKTNLVYSFSCPYNHSEQQTYIGQTRTMLSRRMHSHTYSGSIKQHYMTCHNTAPTKLELINNTTILTHADDKVRLSIKEALLILHNNPTINRQFDNFSHTLRLKPNRTINNHLGTQNQTRSNNSVLGTTPPNAIVSPSPTNNNVQTHIASSNVSLNSPLIDRNDQLPGTQSTTPLNTLTSSNLNHHSTPTANTNNHFISPNINERISSLIQSTRSNSNIDRHENRARSPIALRPRRQRVLYFE